VVSPSLGANAGLLMMAGAPVQVSDSCSTLPSLMCASMQIQLRANCHAPGLECAQLQSIILRYCMQLQK
jgi:hypothetical protein